MDAYLGMIMLWAPNFEPQGWMFCDGRILQVSSNQALFSLLGNMYGGNGTTTFALPDLRSRVPVGAFSSGAASSLTHYALAATGGTETNTLTTAQMPVHNHVNTVTNAASAVTVNVSIPAVQGSNANAIKPGPTMSLGKSTGELQYSDASTDTNIKPFNATGSVTPSVTITNANAGSGAPVDNRQPYLALNYVICVEGLYPSRS